MEWLIGIILFVIFAKKGLKAQGKEIHAKEAVAAIAANTAIEMAELFEVEVKDTSAQKGKRS